MGRMTRIVTASTFVAMMASCGESSPEAAEPRNGAAEDQRDVSVTFSPTGCALTGSGQATSGRVAFALVNETGGGARLHVWKIEADHDYADFSTHIEEEAARIEAGEEPIGAPSYATFVTEVTAEADGSTAEEATVGEGVYAFACLPGAGAEHLAIYSAGPLEVTA